MSDVEPLEIVLPPGVVKTDSALASAQRYVDSDNVRWFRGRAQKIGGNVALLDAPLGQPIRGMHTWNDLQSKQWLAAGTASKLYAMLVPDYTPVDITPTGLAPGFVDPTYGYGWGAGPWGTGTWGTSRTKIAFLFDPRIWDLDNFGSILLASAPNTTLYVWDPAVSPEVPAAMANGAPTLIKGFYTTAERFVICFGTTGPAGESQSLMRIYWAAQGLYDDWSVTHTQAELAALPGAPAGSRQLQFGSRIMAGADIGNFTSLIWTDAALYTHQYTGGTFTFNTLLAGTKCGLLSRYGFVIAAGVAFWMSTGKFWMYAGSVQPIPNAADISEWFFPQLRQDFGSKAIAYYNLRFSEVWFCIVPNGASEPLLAAVYNIEGQFWFPCSIDRTAATTYSQFDPSVVLADPTGMIYQHEDGLDDNGAALPWHLLSGYFDVDKGKESCDILGLMPDMERQVGDIAALITGLDRTPQPQIDAETETFGPTDGVVDFRVSGRELSLLLSGDGVGCDFRMGAPRVQYQPAGGRR